MTSSPWPADRQGISKFSIRQRGAQFTRFVQLQLPVRDPRSVSVQAARTYCKIYLYLARALLSTLVTIKALL